MIIKINECTGENAIRLLNAKGNCDEALADISKIETQLECFDFDLLSAIKENVLESQKELSGLSTSLNKLKTINDSVFSSYSSNDTLTKKRIEASDKCESNYNKLENEANKSGSATANEKQKTDSTAKDSTSNNSKQNNNTVNNSGATSTNESKTSSTVASAIGSTISTVSNAVNKVVSTVKDTIQNITSGIKNGILNLFGKSSSTSIEYKNTRRNVTTEAGDVLPEYAQMVSAKDFVSDNWPSWYKGKGCTVAASATALSGLLDKQIFPKDIINSNYKGDRLDIGTSGFWYAKNNGIAYRDLSSIEEAWNNYISNPDKYSVPIAYVKVGSENHAVNIVGKTEKGWKVMDSSGLHIEEYIPGKSGSNLENSVKNKVLSGSLIRAWQYSL